MNPARAARKHKIGCNSEEYFEDEIRLVNVRLVLALRDVQKAGNKGVALLRPERIGDAQLNVFLFAGFLQPALEFAERGMESSLIL